jgi:hypothetical protein
MLISIKWLSFHAYLISHYGYLISYRGFGDPLTNLVEALVAALLIARLISHHPDGFSIERR